MSWRSSHRSPSPCASLGEVAVLELVARADCTVDGWVPSRAVWLSAQAGYDRTVRRLRSLRDVGLLEAEHRGVRGAWWRLTDAGHRALADRAIEGLAA